MIPASTPNMNEPAKWLAAWRLRCISHCMPFCIGFESVSICCLAASKHFELITVTIPSTAKEQQKASKRSRARGAAWLIGGLALNQTHSLVQEETQTLPLKENKKEISKCSRARGAAPCGRGPARPCGLADWLTGALSAKSNQKEDSKCSRARGATPCGGDPRAHAAWLTG